MSIVSGTRDHKRVFPAWEVRAQKPVYYRVEESTDIFNANNSSILSHGFREDCYRKRCLIIIDRTVEHLYGQKMRAYFRHYGVEIEVVIIDSTESEKNMDNVFRVATAINRFNLLRRGEPVIGVGGGVLLDIVGFAASIYRRGTPYIRIPTTLMGLIDAGIGIKTGVNFELHKNRLGSYCPPLISYLDRTFLKTLHERHMSNGLAEILKIALIKDNKLFQLMEKNMGSLVSDRLQDKPEHDQIFHRAVRGMLEELEPNLWEDRLERAVDYGHSFSPMIEMNALPELLHGEAVNIDMVFSLILAKQRGLFSSRDLERTLRIMRCLDLPTFHKTCSLELLEQALDDTVKHRGGLQRLPLTNGIGRCSFVNDVSAQEMKSAATEFEKVLGGSVQLLATI